MKKINKKFLIILISCIVACCLVATGTIILVNLLKDKEPEKESVVPEISFSIAEKSLIIGDEEYLMPTYKKIEGFSLTFESSDQAVVSVDAEGKISAEREGSATIKAVYSNGTDKAEASVLVHSSFSGYLPELNVMGVSTDITITLDYEYKILSYISFNGKQFEDADVTITVLNGAVAEVVGDGKIKANAKGKTDVLLEASWRGKDKTNAPTMQKLLSLSVIDDVRFYNAGNPIIDEVLYTLSEFEEKSYKNSLPNEFKVNINGTAQDVELTVENPEIVSVSGDKLVANAFGTTTVLIQKTVDSDTYSRTFNIEVQRVEKVVDGIVPLFSTVDGTYLDSNKEKRQVLSFIGISDTAIDAYQNGRELSVDGGKIFGVESSSETKRGTAEITVGTANVVYKFGLETLAKAIAVKEDLKSLELTDGKILSGYYELMGDIDASGISLTHVTSNGAKFSGLFNGNGHVIKNLSLNVNSSMFGVLDSTAIVKNFALYNLNATKAFFLAQDTANDGLTISNVYIGLSQSTVTPRGITGRTGQNSTYSNVVMEYLGSNAEINRDYQEQWTWQGLVGGMWTYEQDGKLYAQDKKWSDVYVISPFVVSFRTDDKKHEGQSTAVYGYGANETKDVYGNALDTALHHRDNPNLGEKWWTTAYYDVSYTNLYHYANYAEMKAENIDYSSFTSDFWVVSDGIVYWKELFVEQIEVKLYKTDILGISEQELDDLKIAGKGTAVKIKAFYNGNELDDKSVEVLDSTYLTWMPVVNYLKLEQVPPIEKGNIGIKLTVNLDFGTIEKIVYVMAINEIVNVSTVYDLISEEDGKMAGNPFPMSAIIGQEQVVSVYQGSTLLTYDAQGGTLKGLKANIQGLGEERVVEPVELTINTQNKVFAVNVKVYSKVIVTEKDLQYFNQTKAGNENNVYDGYYVLAKNITDLSDYYNNTVENGAGLKAFTGTFDGNGYSITAKVTKGMFGILGNGAVIKNVAFKNMQVLVSDSVQSTAIIAGYINNSTDVAVVKDVYVSVDESNSYRQWLSKWFTTAMLISNNASLKSKFKNIVIEANINHSNYNDPNNGAGAEPCLFRYWNGIENATAGGQYASNTAEDSLVNVYVICKDTTNMGGLFRVTAGIGKNPSVSMALCYNDYMNASASAKVTQRYLPEFYNDGTKNYVTMRRYDDYLAMQQDGNDYSLFNGTCWTLTGAYPVWTK